jgi:LysM repeat protein
MRARILVLTVAFLLVLLAFAGTTPVGAAPADAGPVYHTVRSGETLFSIGRLYGVDPSAIARANGLRNPNAIYPGQRLLIPSTATSRIHIVKRGETLFSIASRYGTTVESIVNANRLTNPNRITVGQRLIIPKGAVPGPVRLTAISVWPATYNAGWYQVTGDAWVIVQASGAVRVDFFSAPTGTGQEPRLLGIDRNGSDGWSVRWTIPPQTSWHAWAVAYGYTGGKATSETLSVYRN